MNKFTLDPASKEQLNGEEHCPICLESYMDGQTLAKTKCNHCFHFTCLTDAFTSTEGLCPMCKTLCIPPPRYQTWATRCLFWLGCAIIAMTLCIQLLVIPILSFAMSIRIFRNDDGTIIMEQYQERDVQFECDNSVIITCFVVCVASALVYRQMRWFVAQLTTVVFGLLPAVYFVLCMLNQQSKMHEACMAQPDGLGVCDLFGNMQLLNSLMVATFVVGFAAYVMHFGASRVARWATEPIRQWVIYFYSSRFSLAHRWLLGI